MTWMRLVDEKDTSDTWGTVYRGSVCLCINDIWDICINTFHRFSYYHFTVVFDLSCHIISYTFHIIPCVCHCYLILLLYLCMQTQLAPCCGDDKIDVGCFLHRSGPKSCLGDWLGISHRSTGTEKLELVEGPYWPWLGSACVHHLLLFERMPAHTRGEHYLGQGIERCRLGRVLWSLLCALVYTVGLKDLDLIDDACAMVINLKVWLGWCSVCLAWFSFTGDSCLVNTSMPAKYITSHFVIAICVLLMAPNHTLSGIKIQMGYMSFSTLHWDCVKEDSLLVLLKLSGSMDPMLHEPATLSKDLTGDKGCQISN